MATAVRAGPRHRDLEGTETVTPLELFFDLVFVFAITQVTAMIADDPTWGGLARGLLVLAAIWWAWGSYAWLTNTIDPDEGAPRVVIFGAMAAMLVVALAIPGAFEEDALAFGLAYLVVRSLHIVLYEIAAAEDPDLHSAVGRLVPPMLLCCGLIIAASAFDGVVQGALWGLALAVDYGGVLYGGMEGWRVSPAHFAERHGLIVIIALGESIVAIGIGAAGIGLDAAVIAVAAMGVAVAAALWWAYFDVVAIVATRRLTESAGTVRNAMARDSYSYLHLPMIAGIVLYAVGLKETIAHVDEPLGTITAVGLFGGVALYFAAHIAFRWRNVRSVARRRVAAVIALVALIPLGLEIDALLSLTIVTAICAGLVAYDAIRFREARARVRMARRAQESAA
jgi:low temperature requirement protein LtrA